MGTLIWLGDRASDVQLSQADGDPSRGLIWQPWDQGSGGENELDTPIIVIVPGQDVTSHRLTIPARARQKARSAIPFMLEDALPQSGATIHFSFAHDPLEKDSTNVLVISAAKMDEYMEQLSALGIDPDILVPDYLVLGAEQGMLKLVEVEGDWVVAAGPRSGFRIEREIAPILLPGLIEAQNPAAISLAVENESAFPQELKELLGERTGDDDDGPSIMRSTAPSQREFLQGLRFSDAARTLNLRCGTYRRPVDWFGKIRPWRAAAALVASLAVITVVQFGSQTTAMGRGADQMMRAAEADFREAFPDVRRIVNLRAQARSRIQSTPSADQGFLPMSAALIEAIKPMERVQLEVLRYDARQNELRADLSFPNFRDGDAVRQALSKKGLRVAEGGSRQQGGRIFSDITVAWQ
ncbi:MAG: type II secretion system protein GspL [Pseudomonadota bacterium]